ncbi:MAG: hypothetical protein U0575_00950 [Phycisphaerales bacterium]
MRSVLGAAVTSALVIIGTFSAAAFGQCDSTCPVGGIQQNDACGGLSPDPNGGCNVSPTQYQDIGAIGLGSPKIVCGTVGTFGAASRDLDWYRFSLAASSKVRVTVNDLTSGGLPATNFTIFIINGDDCATQVVEYAMAGGACPFNSTEVVLPTGNHVVILSVNAIAPNPPACPVTYTATVEVTEELPPQCGGIQSCAAIHATGGCNDVSCCGQVCEFNSDCCAIAWDEFCVDVAVRICGVFVYDCPSVAGAPANDCAAAAIPIACGATIAFDNTNATTDGPPENECAYGKDIWYILQFDQPGGGEIQIDLATPTFDATVGVYALGPTPTFDPQHLPELFIGCIDLEPAGFETMVAPNAVFGDYYLIQIGGFAPTGQPVQSGSGEFSVICRRVVYDTGNVSKVKSSPTNSGFYTVTYVGFPSGTLNAANPQQWLAQPFTVGALGCNEQWTITAIHGYGDFGFGNVPEELCFKIWKRFAFTTAPNPSNAPDYELVAEGCGPYPEPLEIPGGDYYEDFQINTDFQLGPGDYWLTIYAHNPSGAIPALWTWYTNAQGGIGYSPDGNGPGLWRSMLWPVPGMIVYRIPLTALTQLDGLDPTKLYATGFRLAGTKSPDNCPADLNGDNVVDGGDLGILLSAWAVVDTCANFDGSPDGVDGGDLGLLLSAFGPCPRGTGAPADGP